MPAAMDETLLDPLLDSWDRNNRVLVNLLRTIPEDSLGIRATNESPSVAALFMHIHYVRLVFISEDAPDFAQTAPAQEWAAEPDRGRMAEMLDMSAQTVREAVKSKVEARQEMNLHYDHPILLLQHMIWHEGYHHGQIKLALKIAGCPLDDAVIGPLSWRGWMQKK